MANSLVEYVARAVEFRNQALEAGVEEWELHSVFNRNAIPSQEAIEAITDAFNAMGYARDLEICRKLGPVYVVRAIEYEEGPSYRVTITEPAPWKVTIELIDSYYHPSGNYEEECGPCFVDQELMAQESITWADAEKVIQSGDFKAISGLQDKIVSQNGNWEPAVLFSETFLVEGIEEDLWKEIQKVINRMKEQYNRLPEWSVF